MRIAYLTTDEVNHDLARRTADGCEGVLKIPALAELIPEGAYDCVLVDWDYLPAGSKPVVLAALLAGHWHGPVAVHGYHLEDKVRDILSQKGVAVHRRLERRWLTRWLRRVRRRAEGRRLAPADVSRTPANAHAQRTVLPQRRTLRRENLIPVVLPRPSRSALARTMPITVTTASTWNSMPSRTGRKFVNR
jgi:hypothetical protein